MQFNYLKKSDSKLYKLINSEIKRQKETINLIASENFVSSEILEVLGSELTNKYSEGYPGKRYYPGNQYYDEIERLAQERALKAFKLDSNKWSVNVQPYSGAVANLEIYLALMNPGDVLMGMELASGGHLSHGHKASFSGKLFKTIQYGINQKTGLIDYDEIEKLAKKHKPKMIISGYSAYARKIDFKRIAEIAKNIGAYHLADISHIAGLVSAGLHPSPFLYANIVMTTTHKTLRGPRAAVIFCRKGIVNSEKKEISGLIDKAVFPGFQGGPHNNVIAAIALTFGEALKPSFKKYQNQIVKNAQILAESLKKYGFNLITNGTDNHLILIDLKNIGMDGLKAEKILESAGIIANRNSIIGDVSPFKPSGLRLGTPAITSRGFREKEAKKIAEWIYRLLIKKEKPTLIKKEVLVLLKRF
ncbi:MAG: serine hydroxymethyltransferase [Patescibacteria group bacterium]